MRLHDRYFPVRKAASDLEIAFTKITEEHSLTPLERIKILGEQIERETRYALRSERHPGDRDKNGDEA